MGQGGGEMCISWWVSWDAQARRMTVIWGFGALLLILSHLPCCALGK